MRTTFAIDNDIREIEIQIGLIKKACKKIAVKDMKDYDHVFFEAQRYIAPAEPSCIVIREGVPRLELNPLGVLNEAAGWTRITPPKLKTLYELQTKLKALISERDAAAKTVEQRRAATNQRYVVWNRVYDFDGVEDRDGFLVEVFDGRGKLLLRNVWTEMLCGESHGELDYRNDDEFIETAVKFMAHLACEGEKIKPVIVYCGKID